MRSSTAGGGGGSTQGGWNGALLSPSGAAPSAAGAPWEGAGNGGWIGFEDSALPAAEGEGTPLTQRQASEASPVQVQAPPQPQPSLQSPQASEPAPMQQPLSLAPSASDPPGNNGSAQLPGENGSAQLPPSQPGSVLYAFHAEAEGELSIAEGEALEVMSALDGWLMVFRPSDGASGLVPEGYVQML